MNIILLYLSFLGIMAINSNRDSSSDPLVVLENDYLRAVFLPQVGGRLVFLGRPGGENLLKSDTTLWREAPEKRMTASADAAWKAYQGHIIWVGPQSQWWTRQDLNIQRRDSRAIWPPDPFLIYGEFKVLELTDSTLVMEGPASPVSGVRLTKKYTLTESGLNMEIKMTNSSEAPVSWDIWSNARFDEATLFFVPDCEDGVLRIDSNEHGKSSGPKGEFIKSAFTFVSNAEEPGKRGASAKAFLHPDKGRIVAAGNGSMLVMAFDFVAKESIHPEQAFVEIYKKITPGGHDGLLELEHHAAYVELQAGESHELHEVWTIYDYTGNEDPEDAIKYYDTLNH